MVRGAGHHAADDPGNQPDLSPPSSPPGLDWPTDRLAAQTTLYESGLSGPTDIAFSPDSRFLLATYFGEGQARLWPVDRGGRALPLEGYRRFMEHLAFSPTGNAVVATAEDFTARVWLLDWDALVERVTLHTTACLTDAQRRLLLGETEADARDRYATCEGRYGRRAD